MARKKIREYDAKRIISEQLPSLSFKSVLVSPETDLHSLAVQYPWLKKEKLVVKPDQCFGKRKKYGLVLVNVDFSEAQKWISSKMNKEYTIGQTEKKITGKLTHFLIEPFIPHDHEYYLSFVSERENDIIYFSEQGGIEVEENWDKIKQLKIPTLEEIKWIGGESGRELDQRLDTLTTDKAIKEFIVSVFQLFRNLDFTYLEFNPFTIVDGTIFLLDTVAVVDDCAQDKNKGIWKDISFPKEFGQQKYPEEEMIEELDEHSGASLKLTILNPQGKIWNILGGGGASIIYLDMIANLGYGREIANYGESSGNPSTEESYLYAKTILESMLKNNGKVLFVVGGIANFTDVRDTFKGVSKALAEHGPELKKKGVTLFVRRGGPHYQEGLAIIKETAEKCGIPCEIHGPETSMPRIVQIAKERLS